MSDAVGKTIPNNISIYNTNSDIAIERREKIKKNQDLYRKMIEKVKADLVIDLPILREEIETYFGK